MLRYLRIVGWILVGVLAGYFLFRPREDGDGGVDIAGDVDIVGVEGLGSP